MTTTGKTMVATIVLIVLIVFGLTYYLYSSKTAPNLDERGIPTDMTNGQGENANVETSNTLSDDSTALSKDQIQAESFEKTLASFESDLENETSSDYYDENAYIEDSNASGDLLLEY